MSKCPLANLTDPELYQDGVPYELLSRFRERGSLVKMDDPLSGVPYWVAVKRDALDFVSKNPQIFSSSVKTPFPQEPKEEEREIAEMTTQLMAENSIINMDPPRHIKYRKVVSDAFTPRAVAEMEPILRQHAKEIVDRVASRGECEFVNEVAAELPLITILEMLGVPTDNRQRFLDLTNAMTFADDPDAATTPEEGQMAVMEVLTFAAEIAEQQKKNPTSTVAAALLEGEVDGKKVTSEMFAWMFLLLLVGGNETTRTVISHGLRLLMSHPDQLQHLVDHPEDIPDAIEEILRFHTAFIFMRRTAMEDVEFNGHQIKEGDKVLLSYHSVNHDEDVFGDDSMVFDIHRAKRMKGLSRQHRSFGIGEHFCLGASLARLELRVMFEEIIPRLRNPRLVGDISYMRNIFAHTMKTMPIEFDPEPAA